MFKIFKQPYVSLWTNQQGGVSLVAMLMLTAVLALAALTVTVIVLNSAESSFASQQGSDILLSADSCVEEGLIRLQRDSGYTGGSVTLGDVTCTIAVTGSGPYTVTADASANGYSRSVQATASLTKQRDKPQCLALGKDSATAICTNKRICGKVAIYGGNTQNVTCKV